jgi:hypothetical protein
MKRIVLLFVLFNFLDLDVCSAQESGAKLDSTFQEKIQKFPIVKFGMAWFITYPNIRIEKNLSKKYTLEAVFFHRKPTSQMFTLTDWYTIFGMDLKRYFQIYPDSYYVSTGFGYIRYNPKTRRGPAPDSIIRTRELFNPALKVGLGYQHILKNLNMVDFEIGGLFFHDDFEPFKPVAKIAFSFSPKYLFGRRSKPLKN